MELRVLRNYVEIVRTGSITRAAKKLFISQPALSMQIAELEEELGTALFKRGAGGVEPTESGMLLLQRAEDILGIAERTQRELAGKTATGLVGTLALGAGETKAFETVGKALTALCAENPQLRVEITSGNGEQMDEGLRAGTYDLALLVGPGRFDGYDYVTLPHVHTWGLYMRQGDPLARRQFISAKDLAGTRLVTTRQAGVREFLSGWLGHDFHTLDIVATYNLVRNALVLVATGCGAAVSIDGLMAEDLAGELVFRSFRPALRSDTYLAWRKGVSLSPAATALVERVRGKVSPELDALKRATASRRKR